jgi:hypothetical protein
MRQLVFGLIILLNTLSSWFGWPLFFFRQTAELPVTINQLASLLFHTADLLFFSFCYQAAELHFNDNQLASLLFPFRLLSMLSPSSWPFLFSFQTASLLFSIIQLVPFLFSVSLLNSLSPTVNWHLLFFLSNR